jgi:HK97 family phage major capsid protein
MTALADAREEYQAAIDRVEAAEDVLAGRGAAATDEDRAEADDAFLALQDAARRFEARTGVDLGRALLDGRLGSQALDDGTTFDELAARTGIPNPNARPGMTLGQAIASSDAYAELINHIGTDGAMNTRTRLGHTQAIELRVGLHQLREGLAAHMRWSGDDARNTLVTGAGSSSGQPFIEPYKLPGVADPTPLRRPMVAPLFTRIPLGTDTLEWIEIASRTNNAAMVLEATSAALVGDGTGGTVLPAAGGVKPESALTFTERSTKVESVAHWIPFTRRVLADAPQAVAIAERFLFQGLDLRIEDQLLNGNGTSPNLRGLLNTTAPWNILTYDVSSNGNPTRLDAVALAAAQIYSAMESTLMPSAMLVHPLDWFSTSFALAKDSQGNYFGPGPWQAIGGMSPWGIQPVITKAVPQGTQVVADFSEGLLGDREQATLLFTDSHADFFIRNILVSLVEARLAFGVRIPNAFIQIVA